MTASLKGSSKWCGDCFHYDLVICNELGVCTNIESDHNRHVLDGSHPGCYLWKKKK